MRKYTLYNQDIIQELINKYGFGKNYILKSIRGDRTGTIPTKIQEEYKKLNSAAKLAVKKEIEKES